MMVPNPAYGTATRIEMDENTSYKMHGYQCMITTLR